MKRIQRTRFRDEEIKEEVELRKVVRKPLKRMSRFAGNMFVRRRK